MKQTDLQKENKKLKRINFILIIYVVISIVIQLYNILVWLILNKNLLVRIAYKLSWLATRYRNYEKKT